MSQIRAQRPFLFRDLSACTGSLIPRASKDGLKLPLPYCARHIYSYILGK